MERSGSRQGGSVRVLPVFVREGRHQVAGGAGLGLRRTPGPWRAVTAGGIVVLGAPWQGRSSTGGTRPAGRGWRPPSPRREQSRIRTCGERGEGASGRGREAEVQTEMGNRLLEKQCCRGRFWFLPLQPHPHLSCSLYPPPTFPHPLILPWAEIPHVHHYPVPAGNPKVLASGTPSARQQ